MINYVIVGCGGVGTRLAEPLMRSLLQLKNARLFLVDGKDVRTKNLARQYGLKDVGMNKAEALAAQLRSLIPPTSTIEITPIPYFLEREYLPHHMQWLTLRQFVLFNVVDNKPSRVLIEDLLVTDVSGECILISGGNEEVDGQAVLSHVKNRKVLMPLPSEIDPEIQDFDDARMPSRIPCDEATESEPQLPIANMGAAWAMLGLWFSQVVNKPAPNKKFNYARFNAMTPEVYPSNRLALSEEDTPK